LRRIIEQALEQDHRAVIGAGSLSSHLSRIIKQALKKDHRTHIGAGS